MTPPESGHPLTALAVLTGQHRGPGDVTGHGPLSAAIGRNLGALRMLPSPTLAAAVSEVGVAVAGLLDVSLIGMLAAGWQAHHDLTRAARRTLAAPGISELVRLARHEITVTQRPSVTVLIDGHRVATVELELSVVFDITALLAGVRDGRLVAVRSGRCDITATLAIGGMDVMSRQASLELPGVIPLNPGIPLLAAAAHPAGAEHSPRLRGDAGQESAPVTDDTTLIPAFSWATAG